MGVRANVSYGKMKGSSADVKEMCIRDSIYGQDGKLVLNTSARGKADLSTLPAGMYIARVQGVGTAPSFHKFVIK